MVCFTLNSIHPSCCMATREDKECQIKICTFKHVIVVLCAGACVILMMFQKIATYQQLHSFCIEAAIYCAVHRKIHIGIKSLHSPWSRLFPWRRHDNNEKFKDISMLTELSIFAFLHSGSPKIFGVVQIGSCQE